MSKRSADPALFGSLCLVFLIPLIWLLCGPVLAQMQPQGSSVSAPKTIVLLYSYGDGLLAYQLATRAFLSIMEEGTKEGVVSEKSLFFEYLDLERKKDKEHYKNLTTLLLHKYATQKIDLIVTVHGPALKFLLNEGRDLSPGTPVLSYLGPDTIETTGIERGVVLLPMSMDFHGTLQLAQKLFPQTMRVVFVNGIGEGEKRLEREAKSVFAQWPDKLEFEYTSDLSVEEMLQRIATLSPGTIVIYSNVFTDRTGRNFVARDVAEMVVKAANVPVFGMYNTLLGKGIIGGSVFNFEAEGARAGMLALDILRGKLPLSKPATVLPVSRKPMFDWQQLKRWEVRISRLPEGSIIVNRPPTVWSQYKEYVIAAIGFCLAQSLLITGLMVQRRRKKAAEEELNQFFNVSLDLKCIANTEGYFLRLNPAWERILGYTREELMAKQFLDFVHPEDLDRTREAVSTLSSQQKVSSFENRYRCKDGAYRWFEWSAAPAGRLIYAAARDVTERKQAEEALEDRLRFEGLVSDLSARFVNIPPDRVDSEIEDGLRQILELFEVDHSALLRIVPDKASFQITHDASSDDLPPVPVGVDLPKSLYPWAYEKLTEKHEMLSISRLDDLPAEANVDRNTCIEWGIRSYLNIPVLIGDSVDHFIHVNSVKRERVWPEKLFPRLRLLGEIFVNALQRRRAEEASRENERILRQNEGDLRGLAGRLISAQEEERSRLARELHDDLAQRLAVFAIDVGRLGQQLGDRPAPVREALREMTKNIVKISEDVHSLSRQLHPSILDDLGLIRAAEAECMNFSRREGIEIVFNHENIPRVIPKDVSLSLYRIIQEGLSNISKHACAEHISISLKGVDHDVLLSVQDDGIGFDSAEAKNKPGLGFSSMRERARLIHGEFSIKSQPEKGTLITVRVPLTREGGNEKTAYSISG